MTLYLAGKSDRDKIVFGSDGRAVSGSNDNLRVSGEDQVKFRFFQPNLVACFSGSAFLTFDILGMTNHIYESSSGNPESVLNTVFNQHRDPILAKSLDDMVPKAQRGGIPVEEGAIVEFYYFKDDKPLTARVRFGSEKPYLKTDYLGKPMPDSVITGGISTTADAILMDMAIHRRGIGDENALKALFLYILDESSEQIDAVGGKYFLANFSYGSFGQLGEDDFLEFYEIAEEMREELSDVPRFQDPNQLKKRARELSEKVKDPMQSLYHLAKTYISKGHQATVEDSIPFYEYAVSLFVTCIEVGNSDTKLRTKSEYCLSYKELGEVCQTLEARISGKMKDYYHILGRRATDKFMSMMR